MVAAYPQAPGVCRFAPGGLVGTVSDVVVRLFVGGDAMLGRGVDQLLQHPGSAELREEWVPDAHHYLRAAGAQAPQGFAWPWGEALPELSGADLRLVNLETSATVRGDFASGKVVHYRMNPANLPVLTAARIDVCSLANNHVLDFGPDGLADTLDGLDRVGVRRAGAGRTAAEAAEPALLPLPTGGRLVVVAVGMLSSGIPPAWEAGEHGPGVALCDGPSAEAAEEVLERVAAVKRAGDVAVVSVHWGENWNYEIAEDEVAFAHRLVEGGVDLVHGHSSHHPRGLEVHRGRLVLYGCGDLVNDYEGIPTPAGFRDDVRVLYFVDFREETGELAGLRMVPMRSQQLQLRHAYPEDAEWLRSALIRTSRAFGTRVDFDPSGALVL